MQDEEDYWYPDDSEILYLNYGANRKLIGVSLDDVPEEEQPQDEEIQ